MWQYSSRNREASKTGWDIHQPAFDAVGDDEVLAGADGARRTILLAQAAILAGSLDAKYIDPADPDRCVGDNESGPEPGAECGMEQAAMLA